MGEALHVCTSSVHICTFPHGTERATPYDYALGTFLFDQECMLWSSRKAFSVSTDMFMGFSLSSSLVQWITGIGFQILNQPCIPGIKCPGFDV